MDWLIDGGKELQGATTRVRVPLSMEWIWQNMSPSLPPFPSFSLTDRYLLNIHCVLGTQQWTGQKPTFMELAVDFYMALQYCRFDLWKYGCWFPPQWSTWTSWEQEPLLLPTQVRLSVFPSLLLDFFCVIKQWLCWTLEARDWVRPWGDSFHPLISYVFNFVSLPLETQSLSMWPLSKSVVFVLAEVRIWRAILLMD